MIKKLKAYEETSSGYKHPENLIQDKLNEVIDVVNQLVLCEQAMTCYELIYKNETPSNPYAEQRKWIGKLCRFWDFPYEHNYFDTLKGITDEGLFIGHNGTWKHCEPVKPDDDVIYKGE